MIWWRLVRVCQKQKRIQKRANKACDILRLGLIRLMKEKIRCRYCQTEFDRKSKHPLTMFCSRHCSSLNRLGKKYLLHKINPTSFKKGNKPWSTGTRGVLVAWNKGLTGTHFSINTEFKLGSTPWNKGLNYHSNEEHPLWKGDGAGKVAIHAWIKRKFGKPAQCSRCGTVDAKRFEWANLKNHNYRRNIDDYARLCTRCHRNYDMGNIGL